MLFFINLLFAGGLLAQSNWSCEIDSEEEHPPIFYRSDSDCEFNSLAWLNKYKKQSTFWKGEQTPLKTIHCNIHIWQNPAGESGWVFDDDSANTPARLAQIENWLNDLWEHNPMFNWNPAGLSPSSHLPDIRFRVKFENVYHYNTANVAPLTYSTTLYQNGNVNGFLSENYPERCKNFAIHIFPEKLPINGTGFGAANGNVALPYIVTFFKNKYESTIADPDYTNIPIAQAIADVDHYYAKNHLGHEFGHALGLWHLYNTGSVENYSTSFTNFLSDVININNPGLWGGSPGEICEVGEICYYDTCSIQSFPGGCTEANNIMSGSRNNENYTPLQRGRMHMNAMLSKSNPQMESVFRQFTMRNFITGYDPDHPWIVTADEEWDFDIKFYQDIVVRSGVTLTVKCVVHMVDKAKIIVEQGARLVVDGGTITNGGGKLVGNIGYWEGIILHGNTSSVQLAGSNLHTRPAQLILRDALIENAACGVRNWKPGDWSKTGGYISAKNSIFRNNRKDVEMVYYPHKDNSLFVNCEFITEGEMPLGTMEGRAHVTMYETYGTRFYGCQFRNDQTTVPNSAHLGKGIYTINANFTVWPLQGTPSLFKNLEVGVHATGSNNTYTYEVTNSRFENNAIGIWNSATDNAAIRGNTFLLNANITQETYRMGVVLHASKGFAVENNSFTQDNPGDDLTIGTYSIDLLEPRNEIYNNTITNLMIANLAYGDNTGNTGSNQGLKYKCNDMLSNKYDIAAMYGNGISQMQGAVIPDPSNPSEDIYIPAANTFSVSPNQAEGHIMNHATAPFSTVIKYVHHDTASTSLIVKPLYNSIGKVITIPTNLPYNKSTDCPQKPYGTGGGNLGKVALLTGIYNDNRPALDEARYAYKVLIDGGNTDSLKYRVNYAYPSETWEMRSTLLSKSPFLSQEVIWNAALKTDVLPNSVLLEILLANPHSALMDSLLAWLENEPRSFEPYMMDAIAGNFSVRTGKDDLENRIDKAAAPVNYAATELIRHYLSDSTDYNVDSAAIWYSRWNPKAAMQMEARKAASNGDFESALELMQEMQSISPDQDAALRHYDTELNYVNLLAELCTDSVTIANLDSLQVQYLNNYALSDRLTGQEQARNVLRFFYGLRFDLPFPDLMEERRAYSSKQNNKRPGKAADPVKAYPNPATQNIIFEWKPTEQFVPLRLSLADANGKKAAEYGLAGSTGSYVCDVQRLERGTYFYTLSDKSGKPLANGKILLK
jgi:hypothetical protein